jgi:hypothetical protein
MMMPSSITLHVAAASPAPTQASNLTVLFKKQMFGLDMSALVPVLTQWDDFKHEALLSEWRGGEY